MAINEWANEDPRGKLNIPPERLQTQKYRWSAKDMGLKGTCAEFEVLLVGLRISDALVDTSEVVMGTVFKRRVTHRNELHLIHTPVVIFPMNVDE